MSEGLGGGKTAKIYVKRTEQLSIGPLYKKRDIYVLLGYL